MAILAGASASITAGIMGSYVVAKRIVFISGSISHSVLGGMGLFLWLKRTYGISWMSPLNGALLFALISAFLIGWVHLKHKEREDTIIAALWSTGMSLGIIFIALTPGYNVELMHFLFGNILWISKSDIFLILGLDLIVLICAFFFHNRFLAICFDEEQARLQNVKVTWYYFLLLALIAVSVVLLIQVVGAILVIAMLAIPAAIAGRFQNRMPHIMGLAILLGIIFTVIGTSGSWYLNWPPGATIALTAAIFYSLSFYKKIPK